LPATATLSGPLLSATGGSVSSLFSLVNIGRSTLTSTTANPLINFSNTAVNLGGVNSFGNVVTIGRVVSLVSSLTPGSVGSSAILSLTGTGPLLVSTSSNLSMTADVLGVFNGATFSSATTAPLIQVSGGSLTTSATSGFNGFILNAGSLGGPTGSGFSTLTLNGPLLSASGVASGPLNLSGGLVNVFAGGTVVVNDVVDGVAVGPFTSITGGTDSVASSPGTALFRLSGSATAVDTQSGLSLGTDRPMQGPVQSDGSRPVPGSLLQTNGATVAGQRLFSMDTALLEATAPLLNATAQSMLTTATDAVNLSSRANLVTSLGSDLIRLDGSTLNVNNGSLVNVNASKLTVGANLATLLNGATLTLFNGPLITVSSGGFVNIAGSLINFGGTGGNKVNVTNNLCPCSILGGVPVALQNGAQAANVQITNPIKNANLGQLNLSTNAALAVVNGAGSKLTVSGH